MKKLLLTTLLYLAIWLAFLSPTLAADNACNCVNNVYTGTSCGTLLDKPCTPPPTPTPTPAIEVPPVNEDECPGNSTFYPPNSKCYSKVKSFEIQEVDLSGDQFFSYPLTCIEAPTVDYEEIYTDYTAPSSRDVNVNINISEAQLGFLGPDIDTLYSSKPDLLAQRYLFNALFDRPNTDPNVPREAFRSYWRMLDSLSQAQIKAYYLQNTPKLSYYYIDKNRKVQETNTDDLKAKLPYCLKTYGVGADIFGCWKDGLYAKKYLSLDDTTKDEYDALLPFDFDNMRGYIVQGLTVSEENIPYLKAVLSGLKGYKTLLSSAPGLFDFYTPDWASQPVTKHLSAPVFFETAQHPSLILRASAASCQVPTKSSSASSPKTYPNITNMSQSVKVPVSSTIESVNPSTCTCAPGDYRCMTVSYCFLYNNNEASCTKNGCVFTKGDYTYKLTGSATGKDLTVFNNPYVETLNDLILGGKDPVGSHSSSPIISKIEDIINDVVGFFSKSQPSFYKMLLPSFAPDPEESLVSAQKVQNTTDNPNATVKGSNNIYRESNLAQDTMHLLQNCWLVPYDQQSSSKCPKEKIDGCYEKKSPDLTLGSSACTVKNNTLNLPDILIKGIEKAAEAFNVPPSLIIGVFYGEGAFNSGSKYLDASFVEENFKSCAVLPDCDPNASIIKNIVWFDSKYWEAYKDAIKALDPDREPNGCNLLDGIYAWARVLGQAQYGSSSFAGKSCFGIPLNSGSGGSTNCNWDNEDAETAIRVWEFGTAYNSTYGCATKENSCLLGGGGAANCESGGDTCETITNQYSAPSHNACVFNIYLENK